jgi:hypothetical protein
MLAGFGLGAVAAVAGLTSGPLAGQFGTVRAFAGSDILDLVAAALCLVPALRRANGDR